MKKSQKYMLSFVACIALQGNLSAYDNTISDARTTRQDLYTLIVENGTTLISETGSVTVINGSALSLFDSDTFQITNNGSIISGTGADDEGDNIGISISSDPIYVLVNNNIINVDSAGVDTYGIKDGTYGSSNNTITNNNGATITALHHGVASSLGYSMRTTNTNTTVTNAGTLNGNIYVSGTLSNSGKISLPWNTTNARIGTFTNNGTGILEIGFNTDGTTTVYSKLSSNNATFEDGSTINVNVMDYSTNVSLLAGTTFANVVSSDAMDIQGTLNITDNSALLNFEYEYIYDALDGHQIDLKAVQAKTIFDSAVLGGAKGSTKNLAQKLQAIKDAGSYTQMDSVFTALNALSTDSEVAQKIEETTPQTATSSLSASNHVSQSISNIVTQRQNVNLGGGLNSGDEMFSEKNLWVKPFGSFGKQNDKNGINGFDMNTYGIGLGVDGEYKPNQTLGLAFFYTKADVDVNNVSQSTSLDVFSAIVYGQAPLIDDKTKFMYQLGYSLQKNDTSRYVSLTGQTATADYTSKTASLDLKLLRDYKVSDDLLLQPMVSTTYKHFNNPSYNETGAESLNLDVEEFSSTELLFGLGTVVHYMVNDSSKIIGNANIDYDLHDKTQTVTSSYQGASGVTFDTDGIDNGRWSYDVGVGYEHQINELSNINLSYNYQGKGSDFSNNVISAKYTYKF